MGMKTAFRHCAIVLAAFVNGGAAAVLVVVVLQTAWFDLGWHRLVGQVFAGLNSAAGGYASIVWSNLPDYFIALGLGIVWGLLLPRRWLLAAISASAGFVLVPHVALLLNEGGHPWGSMGLPGAGLWFISFLPVPLLFFGAYCGARLRTMRPQLRSHDTSTLIPNTERETLTG
jgi:hypothetical protein